MKQTCEKRRCLQPQLPVCAYCSYCKLDGWGNEPKVQGKETERPEQPPDLFECTVCLDIVHPKCAERNCGLGRKNDGMYVAFLKMSIIPNYYVVLIHIFPDLSNSWECAKCMNSGYSSVPSRQRHHNSGTADEEPDFKRSKSGDNNLAV